MSAHAEYVRVTVEGVGAIALPRQTEVGRLQGYLPADMQLPARLLWRHSGGQSELLYDPYDNEDDPERLIVLKDGDHLIFAPEGSYA